MIGIHPVHRRLAELTNKARKLGSYSALSPVERQELEHCLKVNYDLVFNLDSLKAVAFVAYESGDLEWQRELCERIDKLEAKLL
ncbi:hypothetical protein M6D81_10345 [Paenibacillus sp. J5C_2022]|uniref:DUF7667 family protein n=1 Tax=Paenibacillus sp. J5C2022 TaxID=2977129 RepID=UPI0021D212EE|nr:hypothetical protein [Paenibacillus sp. J5C2022]MCU6709110.1 hypothetical protein [Paenibacillus sp. J5C2022]